MRDLLNNFILLIIITAAYSAPQPLFRSRINYDTATWSAWSAWSECSGVQQVRIRACRAIRGFTCLGDNSQVQSCSIGPPVENVRQNPSFLPLPPKNAHNRFSTRFIHTRPHHQQQPTYARDTFPSSYDDGVSELDRRWAMAQLGLQGLTWFGQQAKQQEGYGEPESNQTTPIVQSNETSKIENQSANMTLVVVNPEEADNLTSSTVDESTKHNETVVIHIPANPSSKEDPYLFKKETVVNNAGVKELHVTLAPVEHIETIYEPVENDSVEYFTRGPSVDSMPDKDELMRELLGLVPQGRHQDHVNHEEFDEHDGIHHHDKGNHHHDNQHESGEHQRDSSDHHHNPQHDSVNHMHDSGHHQHNSGIHHPDHKQSDDNRLPENAHNQRDSGNQQHDSSDHHHVIGNQQHVTSGTTQQPEQSSQTQLIIHADFIETVDQQSQRSEFLDHHDHHDETHIQEARHPVPTGKDPMEDAGELKSNPINSNEHGLEHYSEEIIGHSTTASHVEPTRTIETEFVTQVPGSSPEALQGTHEIVSQEILKTTNSAFSPEVTVVPVLKETSGSVPQYGSRPVTHTTLIEPVKEFPIDPLLGILIPKPKTIHRVIVPHSVTSGPTLDPILAWPVISKLNFQPPPNIVVQGKRIPMPLSNINKVDEKSLKKSFPTKKLEMQVTEKPKQEKEDKPDNRNAARKLKKLLEGFKDLQLSTPIQTERKPPPASPFENEYRNENSHFSSNVEEEEEEEEGIDEVGIGLPHGIRQSLLDTTNIQPEVEEPTEEHVDGTGMIPKEAISVVDSLNRNSYTNQRKTDNYKSGNPHEWIAAQFSDDQEQTQVTRERNSDATEEVASQPAQFEIKFPEWMGREPIYTENPPEPMPYEYQNGEILQGWAPLDPNELTDLGLPAVIKPWSDIDFDADSQEFIRMAPAEPARAIDLQDIASLSGSSSSHPTRFELPRTAPTGTALRKSPFPTWRDQAAELLGLDSLPEALDQHLTQFASQINPGQLNAFISSGSTNLGIYDPEFRLDALPVPRADNTEVNQSKISVANDLFAEHGTVPFSFGRKAHRGPLQEYVQKYVQVHPNLNLEVKENQELQVQTTTIEPIISFPQVINTSVESVPQYQPDNSDQDYLSTAELMDKMLPQLAPISSEVLQQDVDTDIDTDVDTDIDYPTNIKDLIQMTDISSDDPDSNEAAANAPVRESESRSIIASSSEKIESHRESGQWSTWGQWRSCNKRGLKSRTRTCSYSLGFMTKGCLGKSYQVEKCEATATSEIITTKSTETSSWVLPEIIEQKNAFEKESVNKDDTDTNGDVIIDPRTKIISQPVNFINYSPLTQSRPSGTQKFKHFYDFWNRNHKQTLAERLANFFRLR